MSDLYQPASPTWNTGADSMYGFKIDPITGLPVPVKPAVSQVGGATGGSLSGMPSEQDKRTMEYMLKMGPLTQEEKSAARREAMGNQLRGEAGDSGGLIDAGRLKVFSPAKGLGEAFSKGLSGYMRGKGMSGADTAGAGKAKAMADLVKKFGFDDAPLAGE
jgi:hypothetical protein